MVGETLLNRRGWRASHGNVSLQSAGLGRGPISPGQSFVTRFDLPGEYRYICTIRPVLNATTTVTQ